MTTYNSYHYSKERKRREQLIQQIGEGKIISKTIINNNHKNGPEIYLITNTGIIIILNAYTYKIITKLIARPNQIRRYFDGEPPQYLLQIAYEHKKKYYNAF